MSGKKHPVGKKVMDGLRRNFTGAGNKERGDYYLDRSFILLHQSANDANDDLNLCGNSGVRRFFRALVYKRRSKETYKKVVKESSQDCQVIDEELMNLIISFMSKQSTGERKISSSLMSQVNNYFFDFQSIFSIPMDVDPGQLVLENHPSEVTGEMASIPGSDGQDASLQDILASSSLVVLSDDKADRIVTRSIPIDAGSEIFGPYSDEEESEEELEEELSSEDAEE